MIRLQCYDCMVETTEQIRHLVRGASKEQTREQFLTFLEEKRDEETNTAKIHCLSCEGDYEYEKNEEGKWIEK
jgi:hypothetical protein